METFWPLGQHVTSCKYQVQPGTCKGAPAVPLGSAFGAVTQILRRRASCPLPI